MAYCTGRIPALHFYERRLLACLQLCAKSTLVQCGQAQQPFICLRSPCFTSNPLTTRNCLCLVTNFFRKTDSDRQETKSKTKVDQQRIINKKSPWNCLSWTQQFTRSYFILGHNGQSGWYVPNKVDGHNVLLGHHDANPRRGAYLRTP